MAQFYTFRRQQQISNNFLRMNEMTEDELFQSELEPGQWNWPVTRPDPGGSDRIDPVTRTDPVTGMCVMRWLIGLKYANF